MDAVWKAVENAWNAIIDLSSKLVTPDWGALVALIPVGLAALVVVFLAWLAVRYAAAGPARRGPRRAPPKPPSSVHMPGPSFAPLFAALGTFIFFAGTVIALAHYRNGEIAFLLGLTALVLTLLYWLREAMRDYDRIEHVETLPVPAHRVPPPGVHMPGPSFRPLLVSIAAAVLFLGLVFGPALLVAGLVMLVVALVGWLGDAGAEYHAAEEADETGHLAAQPAPRYPMGTLVTFVVLLVVAVSLTVGVIPPTSGESGTGGPTGSPAAGGSPAPGGSSPPASSPPGESPLPAADVTIVARNIAYDLGQITVPAGKPFTIAFVNQDPGIPHNVAIHRDSPTGPEVWKGEIFNGVATRVYQVPALEAGTYGFACTVHPNMTGTLTAQ
ncbi:MAG: cupredoxin domain-containing protein [Chloroflexota bacterium]